MPKLDKSLLYVFCTCINDIVPLPECDRCPHIKQGECRYQNPPEPSDE